MGKFTDALKKAAEDRLQRIERVTKIKENDQLVIKKMGNSQIDSRIVAYFDPKSPITEQYKILKTNILSMHKGKPTKVFVVTSAIHAEGKTVTVLNLAMAMAQSINKPKILVVDADLRRGRLARYLGVKQHVGLSEILRNQAKLEDAIFKIDVENLNFICAGSIPHNPAELLSSEDMKSLLSDLKSKFDYVFIDTPPLIPVTDPGILGSMADGVVMVIQAGRTQRGIVRHAAELLNQAQARLVGYILTNIEYHLPEYIYRYL